MIGSITRAGVKSTNYKKRDTMANIAGTTAGAAIGLSAPMYVLKDTFRPSSALKESFSANSMRRMMPDVDSAEKTFRNAAEIIEETGLAKKGVKLNFVDNGLESHMKLRQLLDSDMKGNDKYARILKDNTIYSLTEGSNAGYFQKANQVVVNKNSLYSSVYHELGHARNANGGFVMKMLQKSRGITPFGISAVAPLVLGVGLLHKVDKEKPKELKDIKEKTADFITNNAGAITLATYTPLLAEEGMASVRGVSMARKYLSADKLALLKKNYLKAWGTYATLAGMVTGAVFVGVKAGKFIQDKLSSHKQPK